MESIPSLVCRIAIGLMNDNERVAMLQMLRPNSKYDFRLTEPGFIENAEGESFSMTRRCRMVLSLAMTAPIGFQAAEDCLNLDEKQKSGKREILLDRKAVEYIVFSTNKVLSAAKSAYRLSGKGGSFSLR